MRIAHITFGFALGGLETMLVNIANEQSKTDQVSIIIINDIINEDLKSKVSSKIKFIEIGRNAKSKSLIPIFKLNAILFHINPDVIHVHAPKVERILLSCFKNKMVFTIHDVTIDERWIRLYKHRYSIAKCVRDDVRKRMGIDAPVIYNGILLDAIDQKEDSRPNKNIFRLVQVSRLSHEKKGQDILIKAVKVLLEKGVSNVRLDIIGEGPSFDYLDYIIKNNRLSEYVKLCGAKDYTWIKQHLKDYDLLVQPSLFEGFGLTVAEGMAARVPVLVSDIEGPMEIINDGEFGFYFRKGDVLDCANKIETILNQDNSVMVNKAWHRINECFNVQQTASNYIREYKKILR